MAGLLISGPKTVFKYGGLGPRYFTLSLPDGFRVVHVAEQYGSVTMWVELPVGAPVLRPHYFEVYGTGDTIPGNETHVGSAVMQSGLVWHVYKR